MSNSSTLVAMGIGERAAAARGEARLRLPIDHLEFETGPLAHPLDEFLAIRGAAAGLRRDQTSAGDAPRLHLGAADVQRCDRALDGGLADPPGAAEPLAEAHDARKGVDDAQKIGVAAARAALGPGDQQSAIVGAEVERGIGMTRSTGRGGSGRAQCAAVTPACARTASIALDLAPDLRAARSLPPVCSRDERCPRFRRSTARPHGSNLLNAGLTRRPQVASSQSALRGSFSGATERLTACPALSRSRRAAAPRRQPVGG